MKKLTAAFLPLVAVMPVTGALGALSISVAPPLLDLSIPPGGNESFRLTVRNIGDIDVRIKPSIADLELTPTGEAVPVEPAGGKWSCAEWITLDLSEFTLAPGDRRNIDFTIKVPMGVRGGRYCVITFEASPIRRRHQSGFSVSTKTGTIIMETVPRRTTRSGEISSLKVTTFPEEGEVRLVALFKNTGNVHVKIKPGAVIKNTEGRIVDRVKMNAGTGTVLPDGVRKITGIWSNKRKMKPGSYLAEVYVDYRGRKRATESVRFDIE